ncbi:hypothetical protein ACH5RR_010896 [Cinchona calisaya]|uniref:14-3-3 domain-containing protein n=1 Tax=Cinchona calisaya TaxID=153742 RepID=A0ABD3AKE4_9GENT
MRVMYSRFVPPLPPNDVGMVPYVGEVRLWGFLVDTCGYMHHQHRNSTAGFVSLKDTFITHARSEIIGFRTDGTVDGQPGSRLHHCLRTNGGGAQPAFGGVQGSRKNETLVFYLKIKGDYHRYLAEFRVGDESKEAAADTMNAYKAAQGPLPQFHNGV